MTLGFLGPAHSFSERAALALANGRALVPLPDIAALFAALTDRRVGSVVVPLENSRVGPVPATLAALVALRQPLAVSAEVALPIRFALYRRSGDAEPLARVLSHAMSFAQCAPWFAARPVVREAVGSNGTAFARVRDNPEPGTGALAPLGIEDAAMVAVELDIQGTGAFETRFVLLHLAVEAGPARRALVALSDPTALAGWNGTARALATENAHAILRIYELTPAAPIAPARLPGRPLLLWRAFA